MNKSKLTGVFAILLLATVSTGNAFAMTFDVDNGGPLPDLTDMTFTVTASGESCNVEDIDVRLAIQHTHVGDVVMTLESPSSTLVSLVDQPDNIGGGCCGSFSDDFPDVILDDSASKPIETTDGIPIQAYIQGDSYTPNGALSDFNGEDPNGVWNLRFQDVLGGDMGVLYKAGEAAPWGTAIGTQLIVTPEADCEMEIVVGGEFLPIDSTALILAGAQTNAVWMLSALAVIGSVAFGALYITSKRD